MSTSHLADLRIRAAASQVVGLDVRGPVSEALGRAGIAVPPAPLAGAVPDGVADEPGQTANLGETTTSTTAPTPAASRSGAQAAPRVVKPFDAAPWPTQKPRPATPGPPAALSGLTADERRVHRILLDALARENTNADVSDGLTYTEKKHLSTLSLPYIDAEIARLNAKPSVSGLRWLFVALALGVAMPLLFAGGSGDPPDSWRILAMVILFGVVFLFNVRKSNGSTKQRLAIFEALRELALLADPDDVTSDALAQADAVIDRLADADDSPRLRLDGTSAPTASGPAVRPRARL